MDRVSLSAGKLRQATVCAGGDLMRRAGLTGRDRKRRGELRRGRETVGRYRAIAFWQIPSSMGSPSPRRPERSRRFGERAREDHFGCWSGEWGFARRASRRARSRASRRLFCASTAAALVACSGLMYAGVPIETPSASSPPDASARAIPKSATSAWLSAQEDVLRLDVPMDHSVAVSEIQRVGNFAGELDRVRYRQLPFTSESVPKAFPSTNGIVNHKLVVRLPRVEDADDVRVLKAGGEADFLLETIGAERRRDLGWRTFSATGRSCLRSWARNTVAKPPRP